MKIRAIKSHFINSLIWRGRKLTAERFFFSLLAALKTNSAVAPLEIFYYSMLSLRPLVFLRPVRVGSIFYKVPAPITEHRRRLYAIKFVLQSAEDSRGLITLERVHSLLKSIYSANKNPAFDKKIAVYRDALDNRSFIKRLR